MPRKNKKQEDTAAGLKRSDQQNAPSAADTAKAHRQIERVQISDLQLDPQNLRKHGKRSLEAIASSLQRFGQQRQPIVTSDGVVIAGNGLVAAAESIGWTEIDIVRTTLTGEEARAYAIADNRSAEFSEWNQEELAATVRSFDAELLSFVGFTGDELDAMQFAATVEPEDDKPRFDHDAYASRVLKQIVLVYNLEQYNLIYDALADYADKHGLSDNSEVIAHLLEKNGHAVSIRVAQSD